MNTWGTDGLIKPEEVLVYNRNHAMVRNCSRATPSCSNHPMQTHHCHYSYSLSFTNPQFSELIGKPTKSATIPRLRASNVCSMLCRTGILTLTIWH